MLQVGQDSQRPMEEVGFQLPVSCGPFSLEATL